MAQAAISTKIGQRLPVPLDVLADFCRRWKVVEFSLFGSILREDFSPNSDVDVLVVFEPDSGWSLFDLVRMEDDLSLLLERQVDLVERQAVEHSENYIRQRNVLTSLETIYAA